MTIITLAYTLLSSLSMGHPLTAQSTYPLHLNTTIGHLIDKIIEKKMHHFLFLRVWRPYVCPLHSIPKTILTLITFPRFGSLHCWVHFVREGDITSEDSIKDADMPLCNELVYTYIEGGAKTHERIGRGWWVSHNPLEDHLTPETAFADRCLTHQLPHKADDNE